MDSQRVDLVVQYALAVAGEAEDFKDRELGPIHLLKFVYLADLAFAESEGVSYTGASWRFHHFGPWAPEVFQRLPQAAHAVHANERKFPSKYRDQDAVRWRLTDRTWSDRLESKLPWSVARTVKSAVRQYANDTSGLLHYVYKTSPMLIAAPGELLVLPPVREEKIATDAELSKLNEISKTKAKKLKAVVKNWKERKHQAARLVAPDPAPRFDGTFEMGQEWLDGLAGEPVLAEKGQLRFSDEVWKSPGRRDPEIP